MPAVGSIPLYPVIVRRFWVTAYIRIPFRARENV